MTEALLPQLAAGAIIAFVGVYLALEGPALGVGLVLPRLGTRQERDGALAVWARTQTRTFLWLVCAAGAMYGAFPFAFTALAQALLIPIVLMLAALLVRSLAAAARMGASDDDERGWSLLISLSSLTVALAQGFCLGGYIRGVSIVADQFVGSPFDWAAPFSLLVAMALAIGYALLGASWLVWRLRGESEARLGALTMILTVAAAAAMATISIATLFIHPTVSARWGIDLYGVEWRYFLPLAPLPGAAGTMLAATFLCSRRARSRWAFLTACAAFACGYAGLIVSVWPYVVPYGFSAARSAADTRELSFTLIAAGLAFVALAIWSLRAARLNASPARN